MSTRIYKYEVTYFIQGEHTQRIKIGKTTTAVSERIRLLQTGSPDKLKLLGICFGAGWCELTLHRKFSQYRLHGEWFSAEPEILEFIEENCITDEIAFFHAYEKIVKGIMTFEEALGIGTRSLKRMADNDLRGVMDSMYVGVAGLNSRKDK